MPLEVIGAGFGRTGTLSLKLALERLGFVKCYHMTEVFEHPEHVPMWAAAHRGEAGRLGAPVRRLSRERRLAVVQSVGGTRRVVSERESDSQHARSRELVRRA